MFFFKMLKKLTLKKKSREQCNSCTVYILHCSVNSVSWLDFPKSAFLCFSSSSFLTRFRCGTMHSKQLFFVFDKTQLLARSQMGS